MKRALLLALVIVMCVTNAWASDAAWSIDGDTADLVHLRRQASQAGDSLGLYFTGTPVTVLGYEEEWAYVRIGDVTGYVMSRFIANGIRTPAGPWQLVKNPTSSWVNMRTSPSLESAVMLRLENGTVVRVLGETADGWSYVDYQGQQGYIMTRLLTAWNASESGRQTIQLTEAGWGRWIHQYTAPGGQTIYFVSELEEPRVAFEDVNFDGYPDIVVMTMTGAKSTAFQFFVYDAQQSEYVYVRHDDYEGGLINYELYPEYGLVGTHGSNGYAGMLHVTALYRWEGNTLQKVRDAVSDEWMETIWDDDTLTSIIHGDMLHVVVTDYTGDHAETVLYERIVPIDDYDSATIYEEEMRALWQGL